MRKILCFIIFLSFASILSAQTTFNRAYHDGSEVPVNSLITFSGDYYYFSNDYKPNPFGQCYFYKYSSNGTLKFRTVFNAYSQSFSIINSAIKTSDNKVLIVGRTSMCDVIDTSHTRLFISKLDTNGVVIFTKIINRSNIAYGFDSFLNVLEYTDSTYFAFTDSVMFRFTKTGQFISKKKLNYNNITSIQLLQNNNLIISAKQGSIMCLAEIDVAGNTISQQQVPVQFSKMKFYNGQKLLGLGIYSKLYKISINKQIIDSSNYSLWVSDFVTVNDTIYTLNNQPYTYTLSSFALADTNFTILSQINSATTGINQKALCLNSNLACVLSQCYPIDPSYPRLTFNSLNIFNKFNGNNFTHDIEVSSVVADSSYFYASQFSSPITYLRAKVKIKNKGTAIINDFTLNCFRYPDVACGANYYQQKFTQLILPGDSAIVTTAFIQKILSSPPSTAATISAPYCIFSTLPNDGNDKNITNDEFCGNFTMQSVGVFVKEINKEENSLNIFPNPFNNNITVESASIIKNYEIINSLGILVEKQKTEKINLNISTQNLIPGIYFIKIETEKGIQIKKVVKQ